ncbi:hypothetical protein C1H46_005760 [Malus baccata]|uniref:Protein BZR1 homolog n=1 Tax=Malus baccata TaxID=106549 RepID=A0A540NC25_MALBA|nr:hypothetical protein C1H46_005760 [Malus baccata]
MAGTSGSGRSESEKEKTKMRERQMKAITTKIFHGLRKHGGYHLSPYGDINELLLHDDLVDDTCHCHQEHQKMGGQDGVWQGPTVDASNLIGGQHLS